MSESAKKIITAIVILIIFIVCLALVIVGQRNIGLSGLLTMLAGLAGLVFLLWLYNRQYK
ncbi:DUF6903 family protein [Murimonas intestini]|uniref:Uncharacterized protein n=1 Tax=Murimonas intestini TaxID=1337051 RepID=A0AB73TB55_9FIRM|nr:hypothetical protein [Murimonas intestini]MCR1838831.1 hypothetical protein [Murimonas intestini]MCR1864131.1 hypothetical protein [Murimonas intestini]MCR1881741.1 hypothetical protein [Murimonas intestini]